MLRQWLADIAEKKQTWKMTFQRESRMESARNAESVDERPGKRQLRLDSFFSSKKTAVEGAAAGNEDADCGSKCVQPCRYCRLEENMDPEWRDVLRPEFCKEYFRVIKEFLHSNRSHLPPIDKIFTFTTFFPLEETKVVIMGQDPYHNDGQAMGLSFSVPAGVPVPPSLRNIYLEMKSDIEGFEMPRHGDLSKWARGGVLLLNDVLTVAKNRPNSHAEIGWREFTSRILQLVNEKCSSVVFMLWGRHAQMKGQLVDRKKHLVLSCGHPSPFSAKNFFGCRHFSRANRYLADHGKTPVKW